jgi:hypothetical protein
MIRLPLKDAVERLHFSTEYAMALFIDDLERRTRKTRKYRLRIDLKRGGAFAVRCPCKSYGCDDCEIGWRIFVRARDRKRART